MLHFFSTGYSLLSSIRTRYNFYIYEWVWIDICNFCWLIIHYSGNFNENNFLYPLFNSTKHNSLWLSRELIIFVRRFIIIIIIIMYRLVLNFGEPPDSRWWTQSDCRNNILKAEVLDPSTSLVKESLGMVWDKFLPGTIGPSFFFNTV